MKTKFHDGQIYKVLTILFIDFFFISTGSLFLFVYIYLFFLALVSIWPERKRSIVPPETKFAIVIPAHNESDLIGNTLVKLREVDYPPDLYDVFVIADNCEDNTAEIARSEGAQVWERQDLENLGKGYVLQWAFQRLLASGDHSGYVVVDADTLLEPDFLHCINNRFCKGAKAVQGYSDVLNPEHSVVASLSYMGFVLNRNYRYKGRTRLGWTSNLMGTGMCFQREIIEKYGWVATSIVEDIEYEMFLHLQGVLVSYAPEAKVWVQLHDSFSKTKGQRRRWDMGKFEVRNRFVIPLLQRGLRKKDISYLDSALELLIPPYSILVTIILFMAFVFFAVHGLQPDAVLYVWLAVVASVFLYTFGGLQLVGIKWKVYRNLFAAPYFLIWRVWVIIHGAFQKDKKRW